METKLIKRAQGPGGDQRVLVTITEKWGEGGGGYCDTGAATWPGLVITILG